MASTNTARKTIPARSPRKPAKERVLIEFSAAALRRADKAARAQGVSRSEFIRTAVEQSLEAQEIANFERVLAGAYKANAEMNRALLKEFEHVDREAFYADFEALK
ncbi:MAG: CopG family transcriptional regulator [Terracidiphilus sp.]|jgi:metal-responsive CopG/Arc/MetJ family transcriptional regulator